MTVLAKTSPSWSGWVWLGVPGLLALGLYAQLFPALVQEWSEFPTLSHGFAIPAISAYLIWARRERLRMAPHAPTLWGLPVLVLGLAGLVVGVHGEEPFIARMSLPITLLGLTIVLAGLKVAREVWLGIAYLVFMIPLPYATLKLLTYRSRIFDATMSAYGLSRLGVPVHRDGVLLYLPNMVLEVADDCSSIPAIAALLSLGVIYASLTKSPLAVRMVLVLATLPFAVSANIIRITMTAAAVYYIGPWTLGAFYHKFMGTVNFLITFLLLLLADRGLASAVERWRR